MKLTLNDPEPVMRLKLEQVGEWINLTAETEDAYQTLIAFTVTPDGRLTATAQALKDGFPVMRDPYGGMLIARPEKSHVD